MKNDISNNFFLKKVSCRNRFIKIWHYKRIIQTDRSESVTAEKNKKEDVFSYSNKKVLLIKQYLKYEWHKITKSCSCTNVFSLAQFVAVYKTQQAVELQTQAKYFCFYKLITASVSCVR